MREDIAVVPVLVQNARMPTEVDCRSKISPLAGRKALQLSDDENWRHNVGDLIELIERILPAPPSPSGWRVRAAAALASARAAIGRHRLASALAAAAIVAAVLLVISQAREEPLRIYSSLAGDRAGPARGGP